MADVSSSLRLWSATEASNGPAGTATIGAGLDDNLRTIQAVVRKFMASAGTAMASASTVDLSTADGYYIQITGTTTITALGTESAGIQYLLRFAGALTLTHNATSLILPGGANITTAAGAMALVISEGSGNWRMIYYSLDLGYMHVRDEKASGTAGGASSTGSNIRTLNTVVTNTIAGASLASNQVTLPAGTYRINATVPSYAGSRHRARLVNVTDSTVALLGESSFNNPTDGYASSVISGRVVITASKAFNITHYVATAVAGNGLGIETSDTFVEVYTSMTIQKERV